MVFAMVELAAMEGIWKLIVLDMWKLLVVGLLGMVLIDL